MTSGFLLYAIKLLIFYRGANDPNPRPVLLASCRICAPFASMRSASTAALVAASAHSFGCVAVAATSTSPPSPPPSPPPIRRNSASYSARMACISRSNDLATSSAATSLVFVVVVTGSHTTAFAW